MKESESNAPISKKDRLAKGRGGSSFFGRSLEDYVYIEDNNEMQHAEIRDSQDFQAATN